MEKTLNIAVAGTGYVGLSLAVLLAQHHHVTALDIVPEKVNLINAKKSPIVDNEIEDFLTNKPLNLHATMDKQKAYEKADFVIIATPTDYDTVTNTFNTNSVEAVIQDVLVYLQICCCKARSRKMYQCYLLILPKPKQSSCFPIPIWQCG